MMYFLPFKLVHCLFTLFQISETEDYLADVIQHLELEERFSVKNKKKGKFCITSCHTH